MPLFYTGGNFYPFAPKQVQQLPFDLLRSSLVTRSPEAIQAALERERRNAPNPVLLPQKMGLTRWHDTAGYGQNVRSMHAALQGEQDKRQMIADAVREHPEQNFDEAGHADGRNAMPRLSAELDSNITQNPVSRGIIPWDKLVEAQSLQTVSAQSSNRVTDTARGSAVMAASGHRLGDADGAIAQPPSPPVKSESFVVPTLLAMTAGAALGFGVGLPTKGGRDRQWGGAIGAVLGTMIYTVSRIGRT